MNIKIKLSNESYCGIKFNNSKWWKHIEKCEICKEKYKKEKTEELKNMKNWTHECNCGCGEITKYKNNFIIGHSLKNKKQTEEHKNKKLKSWLLNGNRDKLIDRLINNNPCKSENSINNMKYNNPSKKDEVKEKISKNNPMNKQEYIDKIKKTKIDRYGENYGKIFYELTKKTMIEKYGEDNPAKIKQILEKRIKTYCTRLSNGDYKIKNNWVCGDYIRKNGDKEWYDSSFELKKMIEYDDKNIIWTKKHKIRIPYINEKRLNSYYVPDFLIKENNKKSLVETKGYIKENDLLKINAGIEYCKNNDMNYFFYLGSYDKLCEKLSYIKNNDLS